MLTEQSNSILHYPVHDVERYIGTLNRSVHARGYQSWPFRKKSDLEGVQEERRKVRGLALLHVLGI